MRLSGYYDYLKRLEISDRTIRQYQSDIDFFVRMNAALDEDSIKKFLDVRKGHTALPAIKHLVDFLHKDNQLSKLNNLEIQNMVSNHVIERQKKGESRFLSHEHVNFMLSDHVVYKFEEWPDRLDSTIKIFSKLQFALSYYCGFEQRHIRELQLVDIDLSNNKIKNLRHYNNTLVDEWLEINEQLLPIIEEYLNYRSSVETESEYLFLVGSSPVTTRMMNEAFGILKRVDNYEKFSGLELNAQMLIRSGVLHWLERSEGFDLYKIVSVYGLQDTQVQHAYAAFKNAMRN